MGRDSLVELSVIYWHQTEKALLVKESEKDPEGVWIPLSQLGDNTDELYLSKLNRGDVIDIEIPEWLAEAKGLW